MSDMYEYIKGHRSEIFEVVLNELSEYMYRHARYHVDFSIVAVYCADAFINLETFQEKLRKTDKLIYLNDNLCCIILDGISEEACEKAAENVNYHLLQINVNQKYYISAADLKNCEPKYTDMIQSLFERLEYAIKNNLQNIVIYQDYVI